jgi:hypothetical protein
MLFAFAKIAHLLALYYYHLTYSSQNLLESSKTEETGSQRSKEVVRFGTE